MTSRELAVGKLEGSLELRDGPDSRRQNGLPLLQGLALCTLGGVRRWSARRGSAAVTRPVGLCGGCARVGKAGMGKSLSAAYLLGKVFSSSISGKVRLFPAGFGFGF